MPSSDPHRQVAMIVRDAGGRLIGRTRLQKVAYLKQLAGFGTDFEFEYRHYGPYSDDLASAIDIASALDLVSEEERRTDWGGWYSIYTVTAPERIESPADNRRSRFVSAAAKIGSIELELAATAAFLFAEEGIGRTRPGDPWEETAHRKPEKAGDGRLERAKAAYLELRALDTPRRLPAIP